MKVLNNRASRKKLLYQYQPSDFENYYDYFFYLHLNDSVKTMHNVGMITGLLLLPFAIYFMNIYLFVIYFIFFYGFGFISHWIYDGNVSRTAGEAPWLSFKYATKINLLALTGKIHKQEEEFLKKYPFTKKVYTEIKD